MEWFIMAVFGFKPKQYTYHVIVDGVLHRIAFNELEPYHVTVFINDKTVQLPMHQPFHIASDYRNYMRSLFMNKDCVAEYVKAITKGVASI